MRQLAIVREDGQVWVQDLDSSEETLIPAGLSAGMPAGATSICNWPTWSPDGNRLAYFRYTVVDGEVQESAVCVASPDGSDVLTAYTSPTNAPIYMSWAPNGRRLAVLLQESSALYLRVVNAQHEGTPLTVAQGAPLYYTWLPDSSGLVANVGSGQGLAATSRLVWIRLEGGQAVRTPARRLPAPAFRAPVWSTQHKAATVALEQGDGAELALLDVPTGDATVLASTGRAPAFVWGPDQRLLAFAGHNEEDALYHGISVYASNDGSVRELVDTPVLAFFWSAGDRLVYVSGDLAQRTVAVRLVDVATGSSTDLGWVRPSRDLLMLFSHFDQYLQSVALVSPAGDEIVFAASRAKELENGSVPTVRQIIVHTLGDPPTERPVGRGRLAFWRPQPA